MIIPFKMVDIGPNNFKFFSLVPLVGVWRFLYISLLVIFVTVSEHVFH